MLGPAIAVLMLIVGPPEDLSVPAWRTAAIGLLMAIWWATEAVPIAVTALLPILLFPMFGVRVRVVVVVAALFVVIGLIPH